MLQTSVLALVQSITEFLPISSSGHLILIPRFLGWPDQGMAVDIALHVGTLFSVMLYFRKDVAAMFWGGIDLLRRRFATPVAGLVLKIMTACVPVFIIGFLFHSRIEDVFRSPRVIAYTAVIFGILLYLADKKGKTDKNVDSMSLKDAFIIGLAQVLALIPGVSRSGITMTAARALGIGREESARFSMLLAIPTIAAAGAVAAMEFIFKNPAPGNIGTVSVLWGMLISFAGGVVVISFLMNWLKHWSFAVFAVYRILLGIFLFYTF